MDCVWSCLSIILHCKNELDVAVGGKPFVAMYILVQDAEYLYHWQKVISFSKLSCRLSCRWFILLLTCLPWNIHRSGQYSNQDSSYVFISTLLFSKVKNLKILLRGINKKLAIKGAGGLDESVKKEKSVGKTSFQKMLNVLKSCKKMKSTDVKAVVK